MRMRKWALWTAALLLLAVLMGCLDFDEQTVYVEHDQQNDRLVMIINYRSFYSDNEDIPQAKEQLQKALENGTVALGANWPWLFPLRELRWDLRHPDEEDKEEFPQEMRQDLLRLLDRIRVLNGGFYTDPAGRICGAQVLVIEQAADSIQLANRLITAAVLEAAEEEVGGPGEELLRSLWLEHAHKGHKWIELDGHSFLISILCPEELLKEGRREVVENMFEPGEKDANSHLRYLRAIFANPVFVWPEGDFVKLKCGYVSAASVFVTKPQGGQYAPNVVDHITETYGLHLDANLARYLIEPQASAETEAERAARIMASRLTKPERIRVLVRRLKTAPADEYWAKLREEEPPEPEEPEAEPQEPAELPDEELLELWERWLQQQAGVVEDTAADEPAAPTPSDE